MVAVGFYRFPDDIPVYAGEAFVGSKGVGDVFEIQVDVVEGRSVGLGPAILEGVEQRGLPESSNLHSGGSGSNRIKACREREIGIDLRSITAGAAVPQEEGMRLDSRSRKRGRGRTQRSAPYEGSGRFTFLVVNYPLSIARCPQDLVAFHM